jgi:hypothetical protein
MTATLTGHVFGTHRSMSALTKSARLLAGIRVAEVMTGCTVDDAGILPCPACDRGFNVRNGGQIDHTPGKSASGVDTYVGGAFVLICASCNQHRAGLQVNGGDVNGAARYMADVERASRLVPYIGGTVARRILATMPEQDEATNNGNVGRFDAEAWSNYRQA